MHHPATIKWVASLSKAPGLVFGPNLRANLANLQNQPDFLTVDNLPSKLSANSSSNATNFKNGVKYFSIDTSKCSRNVSTSGILGTKPIVSWMRESLKNNDINDDLVDRNSVVVVGRKVDMYPLAMVVARAFPTYTTYSKRLNDHREVSVQFISTDDDNKSDKSSLQNLMDNVRDAARLVDTPTNILNTATFEEEARQVVADLNDPRVSIEVLQADELKKRGMNMIHSVGQASPEGKQSRLAILKLNNGDNLKTIAWVGKGIVYDTGGLSIKSKTGMPGMKADCGGAAGLLFAFKQAVQNGFNQNLYCLLCLAENSVGPHATRPDDIIIAYSGISVEINNTDAEGRLVLGDGVHYATKDLKADICLNMCTLTGAQAIITGKVHAGCLTNNPDWEPKLIQAGKDSGDHCYPMIYAPEILISEFNGPCSDMKNSVANRGNAQSSCAGHFIEAHLVDGPNYKGTWVHVDMAAPVESMYDKERFNGFGVSLMQKLFREYYDEEKNCF